MVGIAQRMQEAPYKKNARHGYRSSMAAPATGRYVFIWQKHIL
jgi:hypothetical protein